MKDLHLEQRAVVWVVDESRTVRNFVVSALEAFPVVVVEYENTSRPLKDLAEKNAESPDVIIMEARYRDLTGAKFIKALREHDSADNASLLVFANRLTAENAVPLLKAGADDFLAKPAEGSSLCHIMKVFLWNLETDQHKDQLDREPVLLVDSDIESLAQLREFMEGEGYRVYCATNAFAALRLHNLQTPLVFIAEDLPGIDGLRLVEALRRRSRDIRMIFISGNAESTRAMEALRLGVRRVVARPLQMEALKGELESILEPAPPLHEIEMKQVFIRRIERGARPFPPLLQDTVDLDWQRLADLCDRIPALCGSGLVLAAEHISISDNPAEAPIVECGKPIGREVLESICKVYREDHKSLTGTGGRRLDKAPIMRIFDLGRILHEEHIVRREDMLSALKESPAVAPVLENLAEEQKREALTVYCGLVDYLDVLFDWLQMTDEGKCCHVDHAAGVAFLAIVHAQEYLSRLPEEEGQECNRTGLFYVMALGGFFHDCGYIVDGLPQPGSQKYSEAFVNHAARGFNRLAPCRIFDAVKMMVRDHHQDCNTWASRYDAATRAIQIANEFENLCRPWAIGGTPSAPQPRPDPYSFAEAALIMVDRLRDGQFRHEDVDIFLAAIGMSGACLKGNC